MTKIVEIVLHFMTMQDLSYQRDWLGVIDFGGGDNSDAKKSTNRSRPAKIPPRLRVPGGRWIETSRCATSQVRFLRRVGDDEPMVTR